MFDKQQGKSKSHNGNIGSVVSRPCEGAELQAVTRPAGYYKVGRSWDWSLLESCVRGQKCILQADQATQYMVQILLVQVSPSRRGEGELRNREGSEM